MIFKKIRTGGSISIKFLLKMCSIEYKHYILNLGYQKRKTILGMFKIKLYKADIWNLMTNHTFRVMINREKLYKVALLRTS